jgi:hypothetical protein
MLAIILIWRMEQNHQIKMTPSFPFQCKTNDFSKFRNYEQKIAKLKRRHLAQIVKIANIIFQFTFFFLPPAPQFPFESVKYKC